jgi:hypothetical protein
MYSICYCIFNNVNLKRHDVGIKYLLIDSRWCCLHGKLDLNDCVLYFVDYLSEWCSTETHCWVI